MNNGSFNSEKKGSFNNDREDRGDKRSSSSSSERPVYKRRNEQDGERNARPRIERKDGERKVFRRDEQNSSTGRYHSTGDRTERGNRAGGSWQGNRDSNSRREGGYNQGANQGGNYRKEGGYNRNDSQTGGFRREGGYNRGENQGGNYRREGGYNRNDSQTGGFRREGGYNRGENQGSNYRREGGYNRNDSQTGGSRREGGDSRGGYSNNRYSGERNYNRDNASTEGRGERRERNFNQTGDNNYNRDNRPERSGGRFQENNYNSRSGEKREGGYNRNNSDYRPERTFNRERREPRVYDNAIGESEKESLRQGHYSKKKQLEHRLKHAGEETELRLNRYISMGGVCSRRDADELIKTGRVKVNDVVVETVGIKVNRKDKVEVDGNVIIPERKVYLVLNKPKDYVTTVEDPLERKTVMSLVQEACKERMYPIGRLDRMTSGVLLFTNDGDLAKKLTHPSYNHKKIYHVFLDKPVSETDLKQIQTGVELEDGLINADDISYASDDRTEVGIEIHSGKNRVVRRIFEHLGYQIVKLDRVYFAGITKKNLPRGRWRFLTPDEVEMLKVY